MLATLYLKSVRDRWLGALIGSASLAAVALLSMWAYSGIGDEVVQFFDQMPEFYTTALGLSSDGGVASLMLSMMLNFLGPFVIAGIAVSIGAAAIAGEERTGTVNILATVPRSRRRVLWSKTAALLSIMVGVAVLSWAAYAFSVVVFGEDLSSVNIAAASVHVLAVALLFGALALLLSAATGQQALASGAATGLLILSFLISGIVPLIDGWQDWAKISPWYYINDGEPLANGVQWGPVLVILAIAVAMIGASFALLDARDLKSGEGRLPLLERLVADPRVSKATALLRGRSSARGILGISLSDGRAVLTVAGGGLFMMLLFLGVLFNAINDFVGEFVDVFPDSIMAMVGYADYTTPEGWYTGEALSIVAPVAIAVVTITMGASLAVEERTRRASVLFANPVSRSSVAWRKFAAMLVMSAAVGVLAFGGMALGNLLGGLGMDWGNIAGASLLLTLLGTTLGAVAFAAGAATGSPAVAQGAAIGYAIVGWAVASYAGFATALETWAKLSAFHYYATPTPLEHGLSWANVGVLATATLVLGAVGVMLHRSRDLKG
ncbi:ABC transporter permease subunit [Demequina sp. NBRC 110052]|uniref:ABC transporter permease subunit n=1 Tax=Demequina sp. NBRC 110052 TaxID=1570341 RepID=UPI000A05EFCF|nr:ABC transporter permease subunit [Demequina sp. NBRC 110052]